MGSWGCALLLGGGMLATTLASWSTPGWDMEILRNIAIGPPAQGLHVDLYRPLGAPGPWPTLLALPGGGYMRGSRTDLRPLAEPLAAAGYAVVCSEYRLVPAHPFPAQLEDIHAALRWVRAHGADYGLTSDRIGLLGLSAGAHLGALAALTPPADAPAIAGVITLAGPMDLTQSPTSLRGHIVLRLLLGGDQSDIPARYRQASPITHITPTAPPFLLLHGAQDPLVPPRQSQRMAAALQAAHVPVTLHIYADLGHELPDLSTPIGRDLLARMQGWLERWLPARAPTARLPAPPR